MSFTLSFVTPSLAWIDEDGDVWTNAGLGRLVESVAARVPRVHFAASRAATRSDQHDHRLRLPRSSIVALPSMPSISRGIFAGRACERVIRDLERRNDVMIVQLPFSAPTALLHPCGPRVYHVCADLVGVVASSRFYRGCKRVAALGTARVIDAMQRSVMFDKTHVDSTRVVTNGEALRRRYGNPPGRGIVSSTLHLDEIGSVRRSRPQGAPFTVLFVGFLRPEKGIDTLCAAFERVLRDDATARLVVVGGLDTDDTGAGADARASIRKWVASGNAELVGAIPFGPALFQRYADADVLVLPSLSEGTPRVLVEARAFGCPVVASAVGGIPSSVDDGVDGLLTPAGDGVALHRAIMRTRDDVVLRRRLVERGYERARATTVEAQADALLAEARIAVEKYTR